MRTLPVLWALAACGDNSLGVRTAEPAVDWNLALEVTDADGLSAADNVTVVVTQNLPPVATLLLPANGASYALGEGVPVRALVTDTDAGSNEELVLTWGGAAEGVATAPTSPGGALGGGPRVARPLPQSMSTAPA